MSEEAYSEVADAQLDELERLDAEVYEDVLTICGLVFDHPDRARSMSSAITTERGIVLRLAVPTRSPWKVFWTPTGADGSPRVEAVLQHP